MHSVDLKTLKNLFVHYGYDERAALIYSGCMELGKSTIIELAKYTNIHRITVHNIVSNLIKGGFIDEIKDSNNRRKLVISNEAIWDKYQDRLIKNTEEIQSLTKKIHQIIENSHKGIRDFTNAKIYKGNIGIHTMLQDVIIDEATMYVISDNRPFVNIANGSLLLESYQKRFARGIKTKMIYVGQIDELRYKSLKNYGLEVRTVDLKNARFGAINIWGNKIALHDLKEIQPSTIIINNPMMANMMHYIREMLWSLCEPITIHSKK